VVEDAMTVEQVCTVAGTLAHQLNNVLGALLLNVGLAVESLDADHPARMQMEELRKVGEVAADLSRQFVALSRVRRR
jgi:hypothetical protein